MRRELLHTPEGVRDIYNGECDKKQRIEQELHQTFLSFGYHTIQTLSLIHISEPTRH